MARKKNPHQSEFIIIGILVIIGIIAIATFVLTTQDLTKAQIQGQVAAAAVPKAGSLEIFLEERHKKERQRMSIT